MCPRRSHDPLDRTRRILTLISPSPHDSWNTAKQRHDAMKDRLKTLGRAERNRFCHDFIAPSYLWLRLPFRAGRQLVASTLAGSHGVIDLAPFHIHHLAFSNGMVLTLRPDEHGLEGILRLYLVPGLPYREIDPDAGLDLAGTVLLERRHFPWGSLFRDHLSHHERLSHISRGRAGGFPEAWHDASGLQGATLAIGPCALTLQRPEGNGLILTTRRQPNTSERQISSTLHDRLCMIAQRTDLFLRCHPHRALAIDIFHIGPGCLLQVLSLFHHGAILLGREMARRLPFRQSRTTRS